MKQYDYILAGGGCAGLSLAYYLTQSSLRNKRVLIIDAEKKEHNDRTWCFWTDQETAFDDIVIRKWPELSFIDERGERPGSLRNLHYKMIQGVDFYRKVKATIDSTPGFEILQATITETGESESGAYVIADGRRFDAAWVFNSVIRDESRKAHCEPHHFLLQHFVGWWIRTEAPLFEPGKGILMDFRTPQYRSTRFMYVLPLSEREALVEYTVFSPQKLHIRNYEQALESYLSDTLAVGAYTITGREQGAIPMTDLPFPSTRSPHVVNIGTVGGAVKPTTGYAFQNIQKQARQIVSQLEAQEIPLPSATSGRRFRFYDSLLLSILQDYGKEGMPIFSALFRKNDMVRILRFLNEETSLMEEARIFASLPVAPFIKALIRVKLRPKWRKLLAGQRLSKEKNPDLIYELGPAKAGAGEHVQGTIL
ncbi:MAG: Lycopene cyclase [Lewinellaceae bacterium]|nr:hypothetical protein [Phaeodactylibacter sp.]MCB9346705.1 Lycopene cyclase [Lewinellaceae bacterium]